MLITVDKYTDIQDGLNKCFKTHSPDYLERVLQKNLELNTNQGRVIKEPVMMDLYIPGIKVMIILDRITGNYLFFGRDRADKKFYNLSDLLPNISTPLILYIKQQQQNFTVLEGVVSYDDKHIDINSLSYVKPSLYLTDIMFFDGADLRNQSFSSRLPVLDFHLNSLSSRYLKSANMGLCSTNEIETNINAYLKVVVRNQIDLYSDGFMVCQKDEKLA